MDNAKKNINIPVLIITIVLSLGLIGGGIAVAVSNSSSGYGSKSYGPYKVYSGSEWSSSNFDRGDEIKFTFSPSSSGTYYISGNGITIDSVKKSSGESVTKYSNYSYYYDTSCEVYLYSSYIYTITVTATNNSYVDFYISK